MPRAIAPSSPRRSRSTLPGRQAKALSAIRLSAILLTATTTLGCVSAHAGRAPAASDGAIVAWLAREEARPPIRVAHTDAPRLPDEGPLSDPAPTNSRARPVAGAPVDVSLHRAPLGSALRLLAEAADLGIVLGEGLTAPVDVELRRVRPMDAMFALARAHHVELTVRGRTVIATRDDAVR